MCFCSRKVDPSKKLTVYYVKSYSSRFRNRKLHTSPDCPLLQGPNPSKEFPNIPESHVKELRDICCIDKCPRCFEEYEKNAP